MDHLARGRIIGQDEGVDDLAVGHLTWFGTTKALEEAPLNRWVVNQTLGSVTAKMSNFPQTWIWIVAHAGHFTVLVDCALNLFEGSARYETHGGTSLSAGREEAVDGETGAVILDRTFKLIKRWQHWGAPLGSTLTPAVRKRKARCRSLVAGVPEAGGWGSLPWSLNDVQL